LSLKIPTTTLGSYTVMLLMPYAKRKKPHFVWFFPLQAVFTHVVGIFSNSTTMARRGGGCPLRGAE